MLSITSSPILDEKNIIEDETNFSKITLFVDLNNLSYENVKSLKSDLYYLAEIAKTNEIKLGITNLKQLEYYLELSANTNCNHQMQSCNYNYSPIFELYQTLKAFDKNTEKYLYSRDDLTLFELVFTN